MPLALAVVEELAVPLALAGAVAAAPGSAAAAAGAAWTVGTRTGSGSRARRMASALNSTPAPSQASIIETCVPPPAAPVITDRTVSRAGEIGESARSVSIDSG